MYTSPRRLPPTARTPAGSHSWLLGGIVGTILLAAFALRVGPPPVAEPEPAASASSAAPSHPAPPPVRERLARLAAPGDPSPTGRTPRLFWTAERQAVWNRMRRENHPLWRSLKAAADGDVPKYGAIGTWATLAYQITGDPIYARRAWKQIAPHMEPGFKPEDGRNYTRQNIITFAWIYDWLYPALTSEQRERMVAKLNQYADLVLDRVPGTPWGTRIRDSDEVVGHYFGLALIDLATAPENRRAGTLLNAMFREEKASLTVGGLDATGSDLDSGMRNAIREFVGMARGGQWIESSEYNLNTLKLLLVGAEGTRTANNSDAFPEITELTREVALAQFYELTPDLASAYQWGDIEKAREPDWYGRLPLLGILAGLTKDDPKVGPYVQSLTRKALDLTQDKGLTPGWYFYLFYDPYARAADYREVLPKGHYALGQGVLFFHDSWRDDASFFGAHMLPLVPYVDHQINYLGDFQLYRKREWAITHPLDYSGPVQRGEATNGMTFAGLGAMREWRGVVAQEFGPNDRYAYLAGATGGQYYDQPYYDPPATFLHEWSRSLFYLPSQDGHSDTVVVFDRTNAEDPRTLPRVKRYRGEQLTGVEKATHLREWLIHPTTRPAIGANDVTWTTASGKQDVRVTTLLPREARKTSVDLDELWPDKWPYAVKAEQKWQVRIAPAREQPWETFLNVVQVSDPGTRLTNTLVQSADNAVQGVVVERAGHPDAVLLFNARPSGKLPQPNGMKLNPAVARQLREDHVARTGATVTWRAAGEAADVYVLDLDPNKKWSVKFDGASTAMTVSDQGVGRLRAAGRGEHTLQLSVGP